MTFARHPLRAGHGDSTSMTEQKSGQNKASRARERIVDAALTEFLASGYGATTIDGIVARANASKATVYKHFSNKEELLGIVIDKLVQHHPAEDLNPHEAPEKALLDFAESRVEIVFAPRHNALRRLVIGEGARFPEMARLYFKHGPGRSRKQLAKYFQQANRLGKMTVDDPENAADIFQGILMHALYQRTLYSVSKQISRKQLKLHARMAVEKFLQLYRS